MQNFGFVIYLPFLPVAGMALFPFILINRREYRQDKVLINHERIHLRQQLETLILPFYILYLFNYVVNYWRYGNHQQAYFNMYFEREAYEREADLTYLKKRRIWAFLAYL